MFADEEADVWDVRGLKMKSILMLNTCFSVVGLQGKPTTAAPSFAI